MAYVKGSLGDNQNVKEYTDGLEGRIDSAFREVDKSYVTGGKVYTPTDSVGSGNYRVMEKVSFGRRLKTAPVVLVTAHTQDPQVVYATATDVDQDGFTMVYVRPNKNGGFVSWIAFERNQ